MFLKFCFLGQFGPLSYAIQPFRNIKMPVESIYGVRISWIYEMANSFYSFVANGWNVFGWNVFGWKMLGEIRNGLKVFGWNEKTPFFS